MENENAEGRMTREKKSIDFHSNPIENKEKSIGVFMVKKAMYQKVRMLKKQGLSMNEISRRLKLNFRTVSRYFKMSEAEFKIYRDRLLQKSRIFESYEQEILSLYSANGNRRLNIAAVYDYLEEKYEILPGKEKTLSNYIHHLEQVDKLLLNSQGRVYQQVPEQPYGKQVQLDFGEYRLSNGKKLYIFATVLSASRYKYVCFQDMPFKVIDVILHVLDAFDYMGGMVEEIVIDQDKLMVIDENHGDIRYTKDFGYFLEEMGLRMYVCRKGDPESKGKIENLIGFIKKNFLSIREDMQDAADANEKVGCWLIRRANGKISQATKRIPSECIEEERKYLRPLQNSIFRKELLEGREDREVDDKGYIAYSTSSYLVPAKYRNKTVEVYATDRILYIFDPITGKEITQYTISLVPGKKMVHRSFLRQHEIPIRDLKDQICNLYVMDEWKKFVTMNIKQFPRYVRDQCLDAKRHFESDRIDQEILRQAIEFCLENRTYSFANLKDTYQSFLHRMKMEVSDLGGNIKQSILTTTMNERSKVDVQRRDISVYMKLVDQKEVG